MAGQPAALAFAGAWACGAWGLGGLAGWLGVGLAYGWLVAGLWQACFSSIAFISKHFRLSAALLSLFGSVAEGAN